VKHVAEVDDGEHEGRAQVRGLARGGALNLVGTLVTQAAGFLVLIVMAWKLGTGAVGQYSQAFAFLALLELLSMSGFRSGLTRYVAVHRADGDQASLRGTLRMGLGLATLSSVLLAAGLFAAAPWLARSAFDDPGLEALLRLVALTLPPSVIMGAALSATQGFLTMKYFAGVGLLAVPGLRLALTLGLLASGSGLRGVMVALLITQVIGAVLALAALRRLVGPARALPPPRYQIREIFSFSMVSWVASLASNGLLWADTILLGLYLPSAEVGRYQIVSRLVLMASLAMAPVNASFAPRIADLYRRGMTESLRRTYAAATSWILRISLPGFVVVAVFSRELTRMFGKGFGVGAVVVIVLVVGKLTDAATGPCGLMLNQSGRVALNMADNVGVLVANVALNLYLIPRYGLLGSAVAWMVSLVLVNAARVWQVWASMGMLPFDSASGKGLIAALAALVVALAVAAVASGPVALLVGAPVTLGVYAGALVLLGLPEDDRMLIKQLKRRGKPGVSPSEPNAATLVAAGRS
jgi:O-antigen/teichoic acid export membrane protein